MKKSIDYIADLNISQFNRLNKKIELQKIKIENYKRKEKYFYKTLMEYTEKCIELTDFLEEYVNDVCIIALKEFVSMLKSSLNDSIRQNYTKENILSIAFEILNSEFSISIDKE